MLLRIVAPHFVAAVDLSIDGRVIVVAPILRYMAGWSQDRVFMYCEKKGWDCKPVLPDEPQPDSILE